MIDLIGASKISWLSFFVYFIVIAFILAVLNNKAFDPFKIKVRNKNLFFLRQLFNVVLIAFLVVQFIRLSPYLHGFVIFGFLLIFIKALQEYAMGMIEMYQLGIVAGDRVMVGEEVGRVEKINTLGLLIDFDGVDRQVSFQNIRAMNMAKLPLNGLCKVASNMTLSNEEKVSNVVRELTDRVFNSPFIDTGRPVEITPIGDNQIFFSCNFVDKQYAKEFLENVKDLGLEIIDDKTRII